jgi:hypothetical protein
VHLLDQLRPSSIAIIDIQGMIAPTVRPLESTRLLARLRDMLFARASMAVVQAALSDFEAALPAPGGYTLYMGGRR